MKAAVALPRETSNSRMERLSPSPIKRSPCSPRYSLQWECLMMGILTRLARLALQEQRQEWLLHGEA